MTERIWKYDYMIRRFDERKRILILGGGFAGAYAARRLEKKLFDERDESERVVEVVKELLGKN